MASSEIKQFVLMSRKQAEAYNNNKPSDEVAPSRSSVEGATSGLLPTTVDSSSRSARGSTVGSSLPSNVTSSEILNRPCSDTTYQSDVSTPGSTELAVGDISAGGRAGVVLASGGNTLATVAKSTGGVNEAVLASPAVTDTETRADVSKPSVKGSVVRNRLVKESVKSSRCARKQANKSKQSLKKPTWFVKQTSDRRKPVPRARLYTPNIALDSKRADLDREWVKF